MGEIERTRSGLGPVRSAVESRSGSGGALAASAPGFAGKAVAYVDEAYTPSEAWDLLSDGIRDWAQSRAGQQIVDPHTRRATLYWYSRVEAEPAGHRGASRAASYDLVLFGKRGLVVSSGTTQHLVDTRGATRWRHRRFDVPIDPGRIRNDHRQSAAPQPPPPGSGPSPDPAAGGAPRMPRNVADRLGNLPLATQRFLVGPFAAARKPPAESAVHARLNDDGNELSETYWAYLFNSDWMAFAQARRYLPSLGGARAPYAKMVAALEPAQWAISAWVAPVAKAGHALVPT